MSWQDVVNGSFELFASGFVSVSIFKLYKEKLVRGVSCWTTGFFACWGVWNLYYYPYLEQWFSFICGVSVVLANAMWLFMLVYYLRQEHDKL